MAADAALHSGSTRALSWTHQLGQAYGQSGCRATDVRLPVLCPRGCPHSMWAHRLMLRDRKSVV